MRSSYGQCENKNWILYFFSKHEVLLPHGSETAGGIGPGTGTSRAVTSKQERGPTYLMWL